MGRGCTTSIFDLSEVNDDLPGGLYDRMDSRLREESMMVLLSGFLRHIERLGVTDKAKVLV